ncbi:hypothetical protein NEIRO03_0461 [Nematocida sp. AWRm78]|nr:hypothetical protein NEIRO02_0480 [Nematocida sp. AWRm79]KAI5182819.1 hypothetical protein NEIRO03_0461 [Nematocida sp. AWRm78]
MIQNFASNPEKAPDTVIHASDASNGSDSVRPEKRTSDSFKVGDESKPFHMAEKSDKEKYIQISEEFEGKSVLEKPMEYIMRLFVSRWFEILVDISIFCFVLIPENYEFFHILYERYLYNKEKKKDYNAHSWAEVFDLLCPVIEGIVCFIHTVVFVGEAFIGMEIPHGLFISICSSHITCILILIHVELIDRHKTENIDMIITYSIECLVVLLSIAINIAYLQTGEKYQSLILMSIILTQYVCRTLTRLVMASHNKFRRTFNHTKTRILLFLGFCMLCILFGLSHIYIAEIS